LAQRTGWSIEYILWEIPISLFHQANHVHLWMSGVKLRKRAYFETTKIEELEKQLGL
jgi:hypothetical protein